MLQNTEGKKAQNFVRVDVLNEQGINPAIGAIVKVHVATTVQQDYVKLTAGFQTQVPAALHFGLREARTIDSLEVLWPDGVIQTYKGLAANHRYRVRKGETSLEKTRVQKWKKEVLVPKEASLLAQSAEHLDGQTRPLNSGTEKMTIVNFWAPWCKPCAKELPIFRRYANTYSEAFDWIGVSVETKDRASVIEAIKANKLEYEQYFANEALLTAFFGADGKLPLPATFVFDVGGDLLRAYYRPMTAKRFEADLRQLTSEIQSADLLLRLGEARFRRGENISAEKAFKQALKISPRSKRALYGMARVMRNLGKPEQAIIYIKRALKRDGGSAYGWWLLGLTESQSENEQAAGPALRKAVKLDPQSMQFLLSLAEHEYRANKFKKSGLLYEEALRLDAKSVKAWLNLAKARKAMNDPRALEAIQEALRLQPQNRRALRWQAELIKASGRK